jgi:quercetin dioxygenase-like cupin family protein
MINATTPAGTPFVSTPADSPVYHLDAPLEGFEVRLVVGKVQTAGSTAIMEITLARDKGIGMHIHHNEDELLYVLDGTLVVVIGDTRHVAGPGTFLFGPRGIPHGYVASGGPCRFTETFNPGGLEQFFVSSATLVRGTPITLQPPRDPSATGVQMVGPVPAPEVGG